MRPLRDGIAGGLCALLPLVVVNALGYLGLVDTVHVLIAGALALVGSPLLGGAVVGLLAGRPDRGHVGGAAGVLVPGAIAGGVCLVALLALVAVAAQLGAEPELLAVHPIRAALAAVCLACVLVAVGLGTAALVARSVRGSSVVRAASTSRGDGAGMRTRTSSGTNPAHATRGTRTLASMTTGRMPGMPTATPSSTSASRGAPIPASAPRTATPSAARRPSRPSVDRETRR